VPGIVPFYEEHDARVEAKYTLIEWYDLNEAEKALEVAHYRIRHSIEYQKYLKDKREMDTGKNVV
jgi:hypothetical protein